MISISTAVTIVVYLLVGALVFGLLYWLVGAVAGVVGPGAEPFIKVARVILLILAVLVIIGILLSLVGGQPLFRP
jgi:hypothetical protein